MTITGAVEGQDFCLTVDDDGPGVPPRPCPGSLTCSTATTPPGRTPTRAAAWASAIVGQEHGADGRNHPGGEPPPGGLRMSCASPRRKERWTMKRILIVEDDGAIAAIERDYLMLSDFQVDIAATGPEGLAMGRSGGGRFDPPGPDAPGAGRVCSVQHPAGDFGHPHPHGHRPTGGHRQDQGPGAGGGRLHHQAPSPPVCWWPGSRLTWPSMTG